MITSSLSVQAMIGTFGRYLLILLAVPPVSVKAIIALTLSKFNVHSTTEIQIASVIVLCLLLIAFSNLSR